MIPEWLIALLAVGLPALTFFIIIALITLRLNRACCWRGLLLDDTLSHAPIGPRAPYYLYPRSDDLYTCEDEDQFTVDDFVRDGLPLKKPYLVAAIDFPRY